MLDHIEVVLYVLGLVAAAIVTFTTVRAMTEANEKEVEELKRWKEKHTEESATMRAKFDAEIGLLKTQLAVGDSKFGQVSKDIDEIKRDLRELLERRRKQRDEEGKT